MGGGKAVAAAEAAGKVKGIIKAEGVGDLGDAGVGGTQLFAGAGHFHVEEAGSGGISEDIAEDGCEVTGCPSGDGGHFGQGHGPVEVIAQVAQDAVDTLAARVEKVGVRLAPEGQAGEQVGHGRVHGQSSGRGIGAFHEGVEALEAFAGEITAVDGVGGHGRAGFAEESLGVGAAEVAPCQSPRAVLIGRVLVGLSGPQPCVGGSFHTGFPALAAEASGSFQAEEEQVLGHAIGPFDVVAPGLGEEAQAGRVEPLGDGMGGEGFQCAAGQQDQALTGKSFRDAWGGRRLFLHSDHKIMQVEPENFHSKSVPALVRSQIMTNPSVVTACEEPLTLPTYPLGEPEKHPLFFEKRVYQGSSGKVYPVPFIDKVYDEPVPVTYRSVRMENEYLRLVLLPEIGGRIFLAQDKTNHDYDFFYRQDVIKPALVGLAGPWVSGGVEFNWPQHHRPGTYLPADFHIEEEADGARTVWMSEHDPLQRLKGMHGIRLRPGSTRVELRARLYNRTPLTHTFLWWANVAARVHDQYEAFFPEDVGYVADHAVRAMSSFPVAENDYYGVDYARRPGANDLSWYRNIPVPTSYMICETDFDFFGGYDHRADGGFIHVADRRIAPGKKQWTWGNHAFGHAWDRELTDPDENGEYRPYIELMAGVYTDNQPDFTYLRPYEVKTFTQTWWPYRGLGPVQQANEQLAIRLVVGEDGRIEAGVAASEVLEGLRITLSEGDRLRLEERADLAPGRIWTNHEHRLRGADPGALRLRVFGPGGSCLLEHGPVRWSGERNRALATEPPAPAQTPSVEELYLTGEHLEQYRHPTRCPETYWKEALARDPGHSRANLALGRLALQRGEWPAATRFLQTAVQRLTARHPNPETGEAHYFLGLARQFQGHDEEARAAMAKAAWDDAWAAPAQLELAALHLRRSNPAAARTAAEAALKRNPRSNRAHLLAAIALRRLGFAREATERLQRLRQDDPLDFWAEAERARSHGTGDEFFARCRNDAQTILDLVFDYADCGEWDAAEWLLEQHHARAVTPVAVPNPMQRNIMTGYVAAWVQSRRGQPEAAAERLQRLREEPADYFFPSRLAEQAVLHWVLEQQPDDRAACALGHFCYDRKRHADAIHWWEQAVAWNPANALALRNLGLARWNIQGDGPAARGAYARALELAPQEARLVAEFAQLRAKLGEPAHERLAFLEEHPEGVLQRDDATVEWVTLLNDTHQPQRALDVLLRRRFHPWEGGEGKVLRQYTRARLLLGEAAMKEDAPDRALEQFDRALDTPANLGEAYHLLQAKADVNYWRGRALRALGREEEAREAFHAAAEEAGDFQQMAVTEHSELSYYRALALSALGRAREARQLLEDIRDFARRKQAAPAKIDYFATSLPNLLVLEDDLEAAKNAEAAALLKQVAAGLPEETPA